MKLSETDSLYLSAKELIVLSAELYDTLSLAARYLFALLGVLIVVRAFLWILSDRSEKHSRIRQLPVSGCIGEFIVITGGKDLPEGMSIPVPWEGVLGSVRSCDLWIPCSGVHRNHLLFSFEIGSGMFIQPLSGCEAAVDSCLMDCHSKPDKNPLQHGSFLRIGEALLRLRIFTGLDPSAGFSNDVNTAPPPIFPGEYTAAPVQNIYGTSAFIPNPEYSDSYPSPVFPDQSLVPETQFVQDPAISPASSLPSDPGETNMPIQSDVSFSPVSLNPENKAASQAVHSVHNRRRSSRWEADWSE